MYLRTWLINYYAFVSLPFNHEITDIPETLLYVKSQYLHCLCLTRMKYDPPSKFELQGSLLVLKRALIVISDKGVEKYFRHK